MKKGPPKRALGKKSRRRPTLPPSLPGSTIGAEELNFRVRNGIGWNLFAIATGNLSTDSERREAPRTCYGLILVLQFVL